ncbi:hypothetical protein J7643_16945 [bacterium]|nr:hypothetical protein [bacterium]
MHHRWNLHLAVAFAGLFLTCVIPARAADPQTKRITTPERRVDGVNQGQKGFWMEYDEYVYRYDPWPDNLKKTYKDLFGTLPNLDHLIMQIHHKERTLEQVLAQFKQLKGALDATNNNPYKTSFGGNVTFNTQSIDFGLVDKYYGPNWKGEHEDKRPLMAALYASNTPMSTYYPNLSATGKEVQRPVTASCFIEISRLARIIEIIDAGIPLPTNRLQGAYFGVSTSNSVTNQIYNIELTRDNLRARMDQIFQEVGRTNSKKEPQRTKSGMGLDTYIPVD